MNFLTIRGHAVSTFRMSASQDVFGEVAELVSSFNLEVRVDGEFATGHSGWSKWITFPSPSYVELSGLGPVRIAEVTCIELRLFERRKGGRLLPEQKIDRANEVLPRLAELSIPHQRTGDSVVRINLRAQE